MDQLPTPERSNLALSVQVSLIAASSLQVELRSLSSTEIALAAKKLFGGSHQIRIKSQV